jgi:protein TonB
VEKPKIIAAPVESPSPSPIAVPAPPPPPPEPVALASAPAPTPAPVVIDPVFNAAYLQNPQPPYPLVSRKLNEHGRVMLRVLVNARGGADEVRVEASSGFPRLDDSARETVGRWKFVPAKRGGESVAGWVLIPINFRLNG